MVGGAYLSSPETKSVTLLWRVDACRPQEHPPQFIKIIRYLIKFILYWSSDPQLFL
jgi:hypothetical protein